MVCSAAQAFADAEHTRTEIASTVAKMQSLIWTMLGGSLMVGMAARQMRFAGERRQIDCVAVNARG